MKNEITAIFAVFAVASILMASSAAAQSAAPAPPSPDIIGMLQQALDSLIQWIYQMLGWPSPVKPLKIALMHYGSAMTPAQLSELKPLLEASLQRELGHLYSPQITVLGAFPLPAEGSYTYPPGIPAGVLHDYSGINMPGIPVQYRPRLWYYTYQYNHYLIAEEAVALTPAVGSDTLTVVYSEPQFSSQGFAARSGARYLVFVQTPLESYWQDGVYRPSSENCFGADNIQSKNFIVDVTMHEIGHYLGATDRGCVYGSRCLMTYCRDSYISLGDYQCFSAPYNASLENSYCGDSMAEITSYYNSRQ